jgi:hypothetical protein
MKSWANNCFSEMILLQELYLQCFNPLYCSVAELKLFDWGTWCNSFNSVLRMLVFCLIFCLFQTYIWTRFSYYRGILVCLNWPGIWVLHDVESSWNVMAHGDAWEGKWKGNWRMEWVASTLRTTSEHGVSSITTTDAHTSAASSRLNWHPHRFKWTHSFCQKMKSSFCACAITF